MPPETSGRSDSLKSASRTSGNYGHSEDKKLTSSTESRPKATLHNTEADNYQCTTWAARVLLVLLIAFCFFYSDSIQWYVDRLWLYLRESEIFRSAYYETVYVTIMYGILIAVYPYAMHYIPFLQRFKVSNDVTYVHQTVIGILVNAGIYMAPLLAADAVLMKRYWDVPEQEWEERRQQWIQTTRALPAEAPPFLLMCFQVLASIVVFDALFFIVHFFMHKNLFLYKHLHAKHHDHEIMHPHVTNQLSTIERLLLITCANYALKLFRCHPLTRIVYVPVFEWLLIDNHSGYDLPWAPHRLAPRGLMGGPAKHHSHHLHGSRHYQPFFNYLDNWLERMQAGKKKP